MDENKLPGTEPANQIDAAKVQPSKTSFGLTSFSLPTPKWAEAAFDVYLIIATAFLSYAASSQLFNAAVMKEVTYFIALFLTPVVKGLCKLFGITTIDVK